MFTLSTVPRKLIVFIAIVAMCCIAWEANTVSGTWRYKMTVVVETPEGIKTGYAVREMWNSASRVKFFSLPEGSNTAKFRGEAVVIDLGHRGIMFAALYKQMSNHDSRGVLYKAFDIQGAHTVAGIQSLNNIPIGKKEILDFPDYPPFGKLIDANGQKEVKNITDKNGYLNQSKLREYFGDGVKIKEVSLELTDEPITQKINRYVGALKRIPPFDFRKWDK